jgi:hypothetical protein
VVAGAAAGTQATIVEDALEEVPAR